MCTTTQNCETVYTAERRLAFGLAGQHLTRLLWHEDVDRYAKLVIVDGGRYLGTIDLDLIQSTGLDDMVDEAVGLTDLIAHAVDLGADRAPQSVRDATQMWNRISAAHNDQTAAFRALLGQNGMAFYNGEIVAVREATVNA